MNLENAVPEDIMSMSDEDFAKLDPSKFVDDSEEDTETSEEPTLQNEEIPSSEEDEESEPLESQEENLESENTNQFQETSEEESDEPDLNTEEEQEEEPSAEANSSEAQEFFNKVTSTFRANGREYKFSNADDVISLMQQGLNYVAKMQTIKPHLKIVKALQERDIKDVSELGFVFDLLDKKPEAISKLIQDTGLDSYEFDEEKAANYVPSTPHISDEAIAFESKAEELQDNPGFNTVVSFLQNADADTKAKVYSQPQLLELLTSHVNNGYFEKIMNQLEHERALGRVQGMSLLDAYAAVGDALFANPTQQQAPVAKSLGRVPTSRNKEAVNKARKAAAPTKTASKGSKGSMLPEDIWKLTDEEFEKLNPNLLK